VTHKILILSCNPKSESFSEALSNAFKAGAIQAGHQVRQVNIYQLNFGFYQFDQELSDELKTLQQEIVEAEQLVFIFPVWWCGLPAKLKAFILIRCSNRSTVERVCASMKG
jgi:putative NADPH-quinone reductase